MINIKQFKRDESQNSNKLHLDKYYTSTGLAKYCIDKTFEVICKENITHIIEPSAGSGSFSNQLKCDAYDIEPEGDGIIKQDYLELDIPYQKGRLVIGNPPYGSRNSLSVKFFKKSIQIGDYIAFILPVSQLNNNQQLYEFDLIYSEDLGIQIYSDRKVHCCFNIYKRPSCGVNKKKSYKCNDLLLVEKRCGKKQSKEYKDNRYDFRICSWGSSAGRILTEKESYAKEVAFYIKNKDMKKMIYNLISNWDIHKEFNITSTPNILLWQIYEYILKNIPELK